MCWRRWKAGATPSDPNCAALEREFAEWNGNRFAITTNSGTAALHMAVAACGCGAGDHVLVTAYSWSSSATCVIHHNCLPVFVDIDFATMNMDVDKIEAAITPKTKAIIVVHLHGLAVNMDKGDGHRPQTQAESNRGCLPGARRALQRSQSRHFRRLRGIQPEPE